MTVHARAPNGGLAPPPDSAQAVTQGHTGALVGHLQRLSELLAEAAQIISNLAENADIQLAAGAGSSLMDPVNNTANEHSPETDLDLLSVADVARILGVGERSVRRWRSEGKLPPAIEFGGLLRWRRETIESWIAEREEASP